MAASSFFCLLLAVGSSTTIAPPSSQCAYLYNYFYAARVNKPFLPSLVPSVNSSCLARYNATNPGAYCTAECQSLYTTWSQCFSPSFADNFATRLCGWLSVDKSCQDVFQNDNGAYLDLFTQCSNATYCSPSCVSAIAALEALSGCCRSADLNGPKALCGQPLIAPCSTVLNNGSVTTPSRECAYMKGYLLRGLVYSEDPSLTPSLNAVCRSALAKRGDPCIPECQSFYTSIGTCIDVPTGNLYSSSFCGVFNNQKCPVYDNNVTAASPVISECSNSTYCSPGCVEAISNAEQYGGCCLAARLNGPKVLCGQQPIPYCSIAFNSGRLAESHYGALLLVFAIVVQALLL